MKYAFNVILTLAIVGSFFYGIYLFGMPYYRYYAFDSAVQDSSKFHSYRAVDVQKDLVEKAKDLGLPLDENTINVSGSFGKYVIQAKWSETVDVVGLYQYVYHFESHAP